MSVFTDDQIAAATMSTLALTTSFFKDPNDPDIDVNDFSSGENWNPYPPQRQIANILDFGYDLENAVLKPTKPAEMIVMVWPRQYGKTEGVTSCIAGLLCRYPRALIGVVSNNENSSKFLIERIAFFLRFSPFKDLVESTKSDRITMKNGARVLSFGQTQNIRGYPFWWVFCDEAAQLEDDLLDGAILPSVRKAGAFKKWKTPSIILLSTPRGPVGRFYDYYSMGLKKRDIGCRKCGLKRSLEDKSFREYQFHERDIPPIPACPDCGANDYEYVPNDFYTVTLDAFNHPSFTREEVEAELDRRGNSSLARQELLGEITTDSSGVFTREMVARCADSSIDNKPRPRQGERYIVAADFGKSHDATVISVGHSQGTKVIQDYMHYLPSEGGDMEYAEIYCHLLDVICLYNPDWLVLDATGIGDPITEQIQKYLDILKYHSLKLSFKKNGGIVYREYRAVPFMKTRILSNKPKRLGFVFSYESKIALIDNLVNLFEKGLIRVGSEFPYLAMTKLWQELINFGYQYSNNNRIIYGTQRDHDDTVIALALLAWGCRQRPYYRTRAKLGGRENHVL